MDIEPSSISHSIEVATWPQANVQTVPDYRPFRYIDDPVCITMMVIYVLNRFVLKPHHVGGWFVHGYLNDVICLPLFVPIILRLQSVLGIRRHDLPPTLFEVIQNWLVFTVLYQLVLPRFPLFVTAGDPWDSLAYISGGLAAYYYWNFFDPKRNRQPTQPCG